MPWQKVETMEEKCRFVVLAREDKANISELCREFGISRKTGYKLLNRYEQEGVDGLRERSRRPHNVPNEVSPELLCEIVSIRTAHPRWGGVTIREILLRKYDREQVPCSRTIDRVLKRCGLVTSRKRGKKRKYVPESIIKPSSPNDVWTVDFKGWWRTKDGTRCVPLTIRDEYSKYILDIKALVTESTDPVRASFIGCFKKYGIPCYIRSDNGSPFCSTLAIKGLSKLSVWWIKQGALPNRIPPASPQYNGGHERMHRDMKAELQNTPAKDIVTQQHVFDRWKKQFNSIRPHRALRMKTPSEVYSASPRKYSSIEPPFEYEPNYQTRKIGCRGELWWKGKRIFLSGALVGETIGIKYINNSTLEVWYRDFYLGSTDENFSHSLNE